MKDPDNKVCHFRGSSYTRFNSVLFFTPFRMAWSNRMLMPLIISPVPCGCTLTPADCILSCVDSFLVLPDHTLSTVDCTKSSAGYSLITVDCTLSLADCTHVSVDCILTPFDYTCY